MFIVCHDSDNGKVFWIEVSDSLTNFKGNSLQSLAFGLFPLFESHPRVSTIIFIVHVNSGEQ